jgi:hypothetical protein
MHDFGLTGELHIALHEYPEGGTATPGVETKTLLWLLAPEVQKGRFYRRGRGKTVCARGSNRALLGGPSTSPLDSMQASLVQLT